MIRLPYPSRRPQRYVHYEGALEFPVSVLLMHRLKFMIKASPPITLLRIHRQATVTPSFRNRKSEEKHFSTRMRAMMLTYSIKASTTR